MLNDKYSYYQREHSEKWIGSVCLMRVCAHTCGERSPRDGGSHVTRGWQLGLLRAPQEILGAQSSFLRVLAGTQRTPQRRGCRTGCGRRAGGSRLPWGRAPSAAAEPAGPRRHFGPGTAPGVPPGELPGRASAAAAPGVPGNAICQRQGHGSGRLCRTGPIARQPLSGAARREAVTGPRGCQGWALTAPALTRRVPRATATSPVPCFPRYQPQLMPCCRGSCAKISAGTDGFGGEALGCFWFSLAVQEPLCVQNARAAGHGAEPAPHGHHPRVQGVSAEERAPSPSFPGLAPQALSPTFLQSPFGHWKSRTVGPQDLSCMQEQ